MKRQEQKEMRREQILDVGLDLFVRNGYYGTTTKEIAEALGISPGLMFHYFKSKDELYIELLSQLSQGMGKVTGSPEFGQLNPLEIFQMMIEVIVQSFEDNPRSAKYFLLVAQAKMCTRLTGEIRNAVKAVDVNTFEKLVIAGQEAGVIRQGDAKALAGLVYSTIQGIAHTYVCFPDIPLPDCRWIMDMLKTEAAHQ